MIGGRVACGSLIAAASLLLLCTSACEPAPESYFPLTEGSRWRYVTSGEVNFYAGWELTKSGWHRKTETANIDNYALDVTAQATRNVGGKLTTPLMTGSEMRRNFWFTFLAKDTHGIAWIARQNRGAAEPSVLEVPTYVLRFPLQVGTSWDSSDDMEIADRIVELTGPLRIAAVGEVVTVPAGTFRKCIKVTGSQAGKTEIPELHTTVFVDRDLTQWFAPKVGLIKQVEHDALTPAMIGSGDSTLELVGFRVR